MDKPKPGFGSSNDGNTARKFFAKSQISSEITGLNEESIINFYLILRILSCGARVNVDTFGSLLKHTLKLYLDNYAWYYMPCTVHKVLFHSCEIIIAFDLQIGVLSEEALEATHKIIRRNRIKNHTRKNSRVNSNTDLLNTLLISSDPFISASRKTNHTKSRLPLEDIEQYLLLTDNDTSINSLRFDIDNAITSPDDNYSMSTNSDSDQ